MAIVTRYLENRGNRVALTAFLVASLLVFSGFFYVFQVQTARAGSITSASDTMNDPRPTATSNHSIQFTLATAITASDTLTVTFPSGFSTSSGLDFNDMDLATGGGEATLGNLSGGTTWGATTSGDIVVTFTAGSNGASAGDTVTIEIGDNATAGATGDSYITNPSKSAGVGTADIYTISIGGNDTGDILVAIIEGVTVSVTVDESLSFTITGETNANCDTTFTTLAGPNTTTTTVPFGTVTTANSFNHACQNLTVSTNASSGYVVTTQSNTSLKETTTGGLINSGTCDGTCTELATDTWATATNNGFGFSATGTDTAFAGSDTDYRTFACTGATTTDCLPGGGETAQNVMSNSSSVSNSTATVEYKLSISGTQPAGTYQSTVTYVATPTF